MRSPPTDESKPLPSWGSHSNRRHRYNTTNRNWRCSEKTDVRDLPSAQVCRWAVWDLRIGGTIKLTHCFLQFWGSQPLLHSGALPFFPWVPGVCFWKVLPPCDLCPRSPRDAWCTQCGLSTWLPLSGALAPWFAVRVWSGARALALIPTSCPALTCPAWGG